MNERLDCDRVMQGVTEYLDDALPPGAREPFEEHLSTCLNCSRYVQEIRQTVQRLGAQPREPMPRRMKENLLSALHNRQSA